MPIYEYECKKCQHTEDAYRPVDDRHNAPKCHGKMKLVIGRTLGFVQTTFDPYCSPVNGEVIASHAARRNDLAKTHSRPWEGVEQERKEAARHVAHEEKKADARLDDGIRKVYHQLPVRHRRAVEGR